MTALVVQAQQDLCSLCQKIVRSRYEWDWQDKPFSRLCSNIPTDLKDWVHFVVNILISRLFCWLFDWEHTCLQITVLSSANFSYAI